MIYRFGTLASLILALNDLVEASNRHFVVLLDLVNHGAESLQRGRDILGNLTLVNFFHERCQVFALHGEHVDVLLEVDDCALVVLKVGVVSFIEDLLALLQLRHLLLALPVPS